MAFGKKALAVAKKGLTPEDQKKAKGKGSIFLLELKEWFTSPGGIITLVLIAGTIWYIHHKTAKA